MTKMSENHKSGSLLVNSLPFNMTIGSLSANIQKELKPRKEQSIFSSSENMNQSCCCTIQDICRLQNSVMPRNFDGTPFDGTISNLGSNGKHTPCCNFKFDEQNIESFAKKDRKQNLQFAPGAPASNNSSKKKCKCGFNALNSVKLKCELPGSDFFAKTLNKNKRSENRFSNVQSPMCCPCPICCQNYTDMASKKTQESSEFYQPYCCYCFCCPENTENNKIDESSKKSRVMIEELLNNQQLLQNQVQELQKLLERPKTDFLSENDKNCNLQDKHLNKTNECHGFQNKQKIQKKENNCFTGKEALLPNRGGHQFKNFGEEKNKTSTDELMKRLLNIMLERQKETKLKNDGGDKINQSKKPETAPEASVEPSNTGLQVEKTQKLKVSEKSPAVVSIGTLPQAKTKNLKKENVGQTPSKKPPTNISKNVKNVSTKSQKPKSKKRKRKKFFKKLFTKNQKPQSKNREKSKNVNKMSTSQKLLGKKSPKTSKNVKKMSTSQKLLGKKSPKTSKKAKKMSTSQKLLGKKSKKTSKNPKSQKSKVGSTKNNNKSIFESINIFEQDELKSRQSFEVFEIFETQKNVGKKTKSRRKKTQDEKKNFNNEINKKNSQNEKTKDYNKTKYVGTEQFGLNFMKKSVDDDNYGKDLKKPEDLFKGFKLFPKRKTQKSLSNLSISLMKRNSPIIKNREIKNNKNDDMMKNSVGRDNVKERQNCGEMEKNASSVPMTGDFEKLIDLMEVYKKYDFK